MVPNARRMGGKSVQRRQADLANLWETAIFRVVVSPEFLQSRGFWVAFCLQDGVGVCLQVQLQRRKIALFT